MPVEPSGASVDGDIEGLGGWYCTLRRVDDAGVVDQFVAALKLNYFAAASGDESNQGLMEIGAGAGGTGPRAQSG